MDDKKQNSEKIEKIDYSKIINNEIAEKQEKQKKIEKIEKKEQLNKPAEPIPEEKQSKYLIIGIILIILITAAIIAIPKFYTPKEKTIDDLLDENYKNDPTPTSYVYGGFSFVKQDGTWYTHVQNSLDNQIYTIPLHFGPKEVENISIHGDINTFLDKLETNNITSEFQYNTYLTFDPIGSDLAFIALATGELSINFGKLFNIAVIAACTNDEDPACLRNNTKIITCENTTDPVIYLKEASPMNITINNNCITIQGREYEIVKGVDRLLYKMYGIMD